MMSKLYEVIFKRKDDQPDETYVYNTLPEAKEHFELCNEPVSRELYSRILLMVYDCEKKESRVWDVLDFGPRDRERDWHKWKVGRVTIHHYEEFDGSGRIRGIITEAHEDHAIMEAEGMQLWIDDFMADMFY